MTRIFNAYQSLRTWVVTHTEHIYAAVIAPFFGYFAPIKNIFLLALAVSILKLIVGVATIAYIGQFIVLGIIGIIAIKLFTGFATLTYIEEYPVVGIIALLAIVYFVYEQIQMYEKLSK